MFQSEMPYDVTQANFGDKGYVGYRVGPNVQTHKAYGVGVYHNFAKEAVHLHSAISAPTHLESSFISPLAVYLNGKGSVDHVLNDKGGATRKGLAGGAVAKWYCSNALNATPALGLRSSPALESA